MQRIPPKLQPWFYARRKFGLSDATLQMARELGMNPKKLGKLMPSSGERGKKSLPEFVARCYEKRFGRRLPETVRSLEQVISDDAGRKAARRARKASDAVPPGQADQPIDENGADLTK